MTLALIAKQLPEAEKEPERSHRLRNNGRFDVVVVGSLSRRSLVATFPKIFKGTHVENPAVRIYRAKTASVRTDPPKTLLPDGELFGSTPAQVAIHPRLVRYFS
jgi:diacylglycerol kinase family enzyme